MIPPGKVQVPGFSNDDQYLEVVAKGAKGLGLTISPDRLSLIVSNGLIRDAPLPSGVPWTLGNYVKEFGGVQARGSVHLVSLCHMMWLMRKLVFIHLLMNR